MVTTINFIGNELGSLKDLNWNEYKSVIGNFIETLCNKKKYEFNVKFPSDFEDIDEIKEYLSKADISWVDEESTLQKLFNSGDERPDVIGPLVKSPVKMYGSPFWESIYSSEWFYSGTVLRFNNLDEDKLKLKPEIDKLTNWEEKITIIPSIVNTSKYKYFGKQKKYILWAENASDKSKRFDIFKEIKLEIRRDGGVNNDVEFRQMSNFNLDNLIEAFKETRVYVCTHSEEKSNYNVNLARAMGVPVVMRSFFNGSKTDNTQPIIIEPSISSFVKKIKEISNNNEQFIKESKIAREYALKNNKKGYLYKSLNTIFAEINKSKK